MTKTTNFEISKKLKEAGFEAEAEYYWHEINDKIGLHHVARAGLGDVKAYDLETILDALPKQYLVSWYGELGKGQAILRLTIEKDKIFYNHDSDELRNAMYWREKEVQNTGNESLANTAGRLWLLLKEISGG